MNDANRPNTTDEPIGNADLLITRFIDGEATQHDERVFERLADAEPHLWRDLALRQRDAALLAAAVDRRIAVADRITLASSQSLATSRLHVKERTRDAIPFPRAARRHFNWVFASAGWAAAIALFLLWRLAAPGTFERHQPPHVQHAAQLSPEEQLRSYLQAPYVIGELEPVMERIDTLSDGRYAVLFLRRIQEVVFLDEDDPLPVDEERHFVTDPAELRATMQ